MSRPLVSIVIATFNSAKLLPRTLDAIKKQTYKNKEVLVIDGGSSDNTLEIAKSYGCKTLFNPKTDAGYAKLIGMDKAQGKYFMTLDHDEVMQNPDSIRIKVEILERHPNCKIAHCTGYKRPQDYPLLNQYLSEYGDPFSLFVYRCSKDYRYFEMMLSHISCRTFQNAEYSIYSFENAPKLPLLEVAAMGIMLDREFFLKTTNVREDLYTLSHLFYIMLQKGMYEVAVVKNDPLEHYSLDSVRAYFPKLKYRVCNNIHMRSGNSFLMRSEMYEDCFMKLKKYLFVFYAITFVPAEIDGAVMAIKRRNRVYLLHGFFSFYVVAQIIWQYFRKIIHKPPKMMNYDGKKKLQ